MTTTDLAWYWHRFRLMSPTEVGARTRDAVLRTALRPGRAVATAVGPPPPPSAPFGGRLPRGTAARITDEAGAAVVQVAEELLEGRWEVLGVERRDLRAPDWFLDPRSGRRAPHDRYSFGIDHRDESRTGNVKQVWELSRHHHLTVLAAAWFVSGDDRFAGRAAAHLRSWWAANPYLTGIHWTSGIEIGIRLVSWTWVRRLLDGWPGTRSLFDDNPEARRQIRWHQQYLDVFRSTGTSANNHVVAEAAGQLVASCAFPWFDRSDRWRRRAADLLERSLESNTFESGLNRELATEYHGLVTELALLAAIESDVAGHPLADATWARIVRMADAAAAIADVRCRAPRQGDGDDGRALLVDGPTSNHWPSLLAAAAAVVGEASWWPDRSRRPPDVRATVLAAMAGCRRRTATGRPAARPSRIDDAGLVVLRTISPDAPEIWCRFDAGPHGFLRIAAHAHADALSVEVRHGGVDVLADPGTFAYHGDRPWRTWFRSTRGHNTIELGGEDQSVSAGPFLWVRHARTRAVPAAAPWTSTAEHDGYERLQPPAVHRRRVVLDPDRRRLDLTDWVRSDGRHACRLSFHLGPSVRVLLHGRTAFLSWPTLEPGGVGLAVLYLPRGLSWRCHRGEPDPVEGWCSPSFGKIVPAAVLVGTGAWGTIDGPLESSLRFS